MGTINNDILGYESRYLNPWVLHTTLPVKPLSINAAHYRNKKMTVAYKNYRTYWDIHFAKEKLVAHPEIKDMKLYIGLCYGFSNRASDVDNPTKPAIDTLQNLLEFNDKQIWKIKNSKCIVPKGEEFVTVYMTEVFGDCLRDDMKHWIIEERA